MIGSRFMVLRASGKLREDRLDVNPAASTVLQGAMGRFFFISKNHRKLQETETVEDALASCLPFHGGCHSVPAALKKVAG
jgi:hypothetical protein